MPSSRGSSWPRDWTRVSCLLCLLHRLAGSLPLSHLGSPVCSAGGTNQNIQSASQGEQKASFFEKHTFELKAAVEVRMALQVQPAGRLTWLRWWAPAHTAKSKILQEKKETQLRLTEKLLLWSFQSVIWGPWTSQDPSRGSQVKAIFKSKSKAKTKTRTQNVVQSPRGRHIMV